MALLLISAPANAGPGERQQMLDGAAQYFARAGLERSQVIRVDVPGRGAGEEGERRTADRAGAGNPSPSIRLALRRVAGARAGGCPEPPSFGRVGAGGADQDCGPLLERGGGDARRGAPPRSPRSPSRVWGNPQSVKKMWERQALQWLEAELRDRGLVFEKGAGQGHAPEIRHRHRGHGQALDQLEEDERRRSPRRWSSTGSRTAPTSRPSTSPTPSRKATSATALRRLSDFLVHGHPLVYLAAVESDLKKRALAAAAPDEPTFRSWVAAGTDRSGGGAGLVTAGTGQRIVSASGTGGAGPGRSGDQVPAGRGAPGDLGATDRGLVPVVR